MLLSFFCSGVKEIGIVHAMLLKFGSDEQLLHDVALKTVTLELYFTLYFMEAPKHSIKYVLHHNHEK